MSSESSRDLGPPARQSLVARLWKVLFTLLASWGVLLLAQADYVRAQNAAQQAQNVGGLLIPPGGVVARANTVRALVLDQVKRVPSASSKGSSTRSRKQRHLETRQLLIVDLKGQKLYMADYDRDDQGREMIKQHIQVRLDGETPRVYTITPDGKQYSEHSEDLNDLQRERDIAEWNEIKLGNRLPPRQRDAFFKRHCHLRSDGKRLARVSRTKGDRLLDRDCEHIVVKENCLTVVDAEVAADIPGAKNYYHLYRRLGVFSEEVLETLKAVEGVPLKAKINVVTALKMWPLEVDTRSISVRDVSTLFFELPPNAELYAPDSGPAICPICKKEFERDTAVQYVESNNRIVLLCSERCVEEYLERRVRKGAAAAPRPGAKRK